MPYPGGASFEVVFVPKDERAAELLEAVKQFPAYSVERFEVEAFLLLTLMRVAYRQADRARELERQRQQREEKRAAREAEKRA